MEFNEKLQELRKQRGLTQEELASAIFVSRTAISKWESGRGYPNIDSLKAISKFFSVTIDELLSSNEILTIAEEDHQQTKQHFCSLIFGLLDISTVLLLFLPFFREKAGEAVHAGALLALDHVAPYSKIAYFIIVLGITIYGILVLALQNCRFAFWTKNKIRISLILNVLGVLLFIIGSQPYPAALLFVFLIIKSLIHGKKQ